MYVCTVCYYETSKFTFLFVSECKTQLMGKEKLSSNSYNLCWKNNLFFLLADGAFVTPECCDCASLWFWKIAFQMNIQSYWRLKDTKQPACFFPPIAFSDFKNKQQCAWYTSCTVFALYRMFPTIFLSIFTISTEAVLKVGRVCVSPLLCCTKLQQQLRGT